jgi:hypothetical protein
LASVAVIPCVGVMMAVCATTGPAASAKPAEKPETTKSRRLTFLPG